VSHRLNVIEQIPSAWKANKNFGLWLVRYKQPLITVDLGVDWGYSSFVLAEQNIGTVYAVDIFKGEKVCNQNTYSAVVALKDTHNYNNVTIIKADFSDLAKKWAMPIDILHIDGEHTYEAVSRDYHNWVDHVEEDGVILFHDTRSCKDSVGVFFDELNIPKYNFTEDCGLGIACKNPKVIQDITAYFET
jgi:predicted O-methyltransferase YrrM